MTTVVSLNAEAMRRILDSNNLGPGMLLVEEAKLRIFIDQEPAAVLAVHQATSELERATGAIVEVEEIDDEDSSAFHARRRDDGGDRMQPRRHVP